jgi:hypothetical protein
MPNRLPLVKTAGALAMTEVPFAFGMTCCAIGLVAAALSILVFSCGGDLTGVGLVLVLTTSLIFAMYRWIVQAR